MIAEDREDLQLDEVNYGLEINSRPSKNVGHYLMLKNVLL